MMSYNDIATGDRPGVIRISTVRFDHEQICYFLLKFIKTTSKDLRWLLIIATYRQQWCRSYLTADILSTYNPMRWVPVSKERLHRSFASLIAAGQVHLSIPIEWYLKFSSDRIGNISARVHSLAGATD